MTSKIPELPNAEKKESREASALIHPRVFCRKHSVKVQMDGNIGKRRDPLMYRGFCADCLYEASREGHTTMDEVADATLARRTEAQPA